MMNEAKLRRQIKNWTLFFIVATLLSGLTAFPLEAELKWTVSISGYFPPELSEWVQRVYTGIKDTNSLYPFISYGTDWLAFAHIIIALLFIGVLKNPVRNKWIIDWAMLCCILVVPLALIAGPIRDIPFFHRLIDCSFGLLGIIPLFIVRRKIKLLESISR